MVKGEGAVLLPGEYSMGPQRSSSERCAPMIIVCGRLAASRTPPHDVINSPSPAKTTASGGAGGTYAVTCRPPSYSNVSVMSWPLVATLRGLLVSSGGRARKGRRWRVRRYRSSRRRRVGNGWIRGRRSASETKGSSQKLPPAAERRPDHGGATAGPGLRAREAAVGVAVPRRRQISTLGSPRFSPHRGSAVAEADRRAMPASQGAGYPLRSPDRGCGERKRDGAREVRAGAVSLHSSVASTVVGRVARRSWSAKSP